MRCKRLRFAWRDTESLLECTAEMRCARKSALERNLHDEIAAPRCRRKQLRGAFEPHRLHMAHQRNAFRGEKTAQMLFGHARVRGDLRRRKVRIAGVARNKLLRLEE